MFEATNNAFLLELFLESNRAKKCRKYSFIKRSRERHVEGTCLEQNALRSLLKKILPAEIKPIEDHLFGVDYFYRGAAIDQKFSFGALGENTIKIRVRERRLLNDSDWTMIINKQHKAEFFETEKLALFVKKNWGIVQKRLVEKKDSYSEYAVRLDDFYKIERVEPLNARLAEQELFEALEQISAPAEGAPEMATQENIHTPTFEGQTIIDHEKKLCFEPFLETIAAQVLGHKC